MELLNATPMVAGYTMGMEASGRELLVAVVKGTFHLPRRGEPARLHEVQQPLIMADTFTGAPGFSAPYQEVDFAPRTRSAEVLFQGSAYAPDGRPAGRIAVGIRLGKWSKTFAVTGDRQWRRRWAAVDAGAPEPFIVKPISYDCAYGGVDTRHQDPAQHTAYMPNPVGRGFHRPISAQWLDGAPLPNTEGLHQAIDRPDGRYPPMAFGPLGRGWSSRLPYGGTYDEAWLENAFPFLPADFDERYYQAAPADQRMEQIHGAEEVVLVNLTPEGRTAFTLPAIPVPVTFFRANGPRQQMAAKLDTVAIYADDGLFTLTWRASLPLRRNIFEVKQVLAGDMPRGWWRARESGKTWYPSLAHLARAKS